MESIPDAQLRFASPPRRMHDLSWRLLGCDPAYAAWLLGSQLWLGLLWFFYQGFGITRGLILCCFLAGLLVLRFVPPPRSTPRPAGATGLPQNLRALLIIVIVIDLGMLAVSSTRSVETGKIPMDEGQTSWRAARLLWHGEDPYGTGALVDLNAYRSRARLRTASGFRPGRVPGSEATALARYNETLDSGIRSELIPRQQDAAAQRESRLYGYKYGPLILLATAAIAPFKIAGGVLILNGLICFALFAVMWAVLKRMSSPQIALAGVAMLALLLDRHITRDYIDRSATDVWALLFGAAAVAACLSRRPRTAALAVALAVGCKTMPGLLFVPMLLRFRSIKLLFLFLGAAIAIYLPWLFWDAQGFLFNGVLWPLYMQTDSTSWQVDAPHWAALAARAVAVTALSLLWLRYVSGKEDRLFWTLAVSSALVLLASGFLRNGYVPWLSLWSVAAILEAFVLRQALDRSEDGNATATSQLSLPEGDK